MEGIQSKSINLFMFLFLFFIGVSHLRASILDFDEVWQEREIAAREAVSEAYHPDPFQVTDHLNVEVHLYVLYAYFS